MTLERLIYTLRLRLRSLFLSKSVEQDLSDEIHDHLERRAAEFAAKGLTTTEARDAALRAFGGVEQRKDECRDARRVGLVHDFVKDVGYAARMARRHPAFTTTAVLSLALGIGASSAIFSIFDALLLKGLSVARPHELRVTTQVVTIGGRIRKSTATMSFDWFQNVPAQAGVFADVLAFADLQDAVLDVGDHEIRASGGALFVTPNYFSALGVVPRVGRVFHVGDTAQSASPTPIVLSHHFWTRHFGGGPSVVGRQLRINGMPSVVVGVAPSGFFGLTIGRVPDAFLPLSAMSLAQPGLPLLTNPANWRVHVVGRLKTGTDESLAAERLMTLTEIPRLAGTGLEQPKWVIRLLPLETGLSDLRARFVRPLSALMTMVSLLLVIAATNVATMLISRTSARRTEMVIRTTMGAGRGRVMRQLAAEALLLAAVAGALGVLFAKLATSALVALLPPGTGQLPLGAGPDWRVLLFTSAASIGAALLAGIAPAVLTLRVDLTASLRERWRRSSTPAVRHLSNPFVVIQVAVVVILVIASGLLARTLMGLSAVDPGFKPEHMIFATVSPGDRDYRDARLDEYYRALLDRLRQAPGVVDASVLQMPLLTRNRTTGTLEVPGFSPATEDERWVQVFQVGPRFFQTLGMTLVEGRDFADTDVAGTGLVAAINQSAARRYFGDASPLGRTVHSDRDFEIVAVVRDARYNSLREEPVPALFVPYASVRRRASMIFAIRTEGNDTAALGTIATVVRERDPLVPFEIMPFTEIVRASVAQERLLAALSTFFAGAAVLLLMIGLYGIMAFWVTERTPEIGVRLALGARPAQVGWAVLLQPIRLALVGIAVGIPIIVAIARASAAFLFGLTPQDPLTIALATLLVLGVAAAAGALPARRATKVDPIAALRCE